MVKLISREELLQSISDEDMKYIRIGEIELANRFCLLKVLKAVLCGSFMRTAELEIFPVYQKTIKSEDNDDVVDTTSTTNDDEEAVEVEDNGKSGPAITLDDDGNTCHSSVSAKEDVETKVTNKKSKKAPTNADRVLKQLQVYTGHDNASMGTMLSGKRHRKGAAAFKCPADDEVIIISSSSLSAAKKKNAAAAAAKQKKATAAKLTAAANKKIKVEKGAPIKKEETPIKLLRGVAKQAETKSRSSSASSFAQKDDAALEADAMYAKNVELLQKIEAATARSLQAALAISNKAEHLQKNSGIIFHFFI